MEKKKKKKKKNPQNSCKIQAFLFQELKSELAIVICNWGYRVSKSNNRVIHCLEINTDVIQILKNRSDYYTTS